MGASPHRRVERPPRKITGVARMLLTVRSPHHLKPEEARGLATSRDGRLVGVAGVHSMLVARLGTAGGRWQADGDWLIELELDADARSGEGRRSRPYADLLGDLRLSGCVRRWRVVREAWRVER